MSAPTRDSAKPLVTRSQMATIELVFELGYKACERGQNLQSSLQIVREFYSVAERGES